MLTILFLVLVVTIVYYFQKIKYQYWEKRGVSGPKPTFFVGNLAKAFLLKAQPGEIYADFYRKYKDNSVVGLFRCFTPILLIRDPDLIKEITIKSFSHFHDNDLYIDKKTNPLLGRHPLVLKGEEWKTVRAQLTPGFTSGKMKWIYPYLEANSEKMVKFIEQKTSGPNKKAYEVKELSTRFTLNNVGAAVFGIEPKCFEEDNPEFRQLADKFLSPGGWTAVALFMETVFPIINKIISIRFSSKDVDQKLTEIVCETLEYREKNNIVRNDFLHILSQLKKTCKDYEFTNIDVTAHAAGFFGDGYETSSIVLSYILFHLASNPEAQDKLRHEISIAFEENEDKLPYEILQGLPYIDAVIHETLRIIPPAPFLQKICTKQYTHVPKETNKPLIIEEGMTIILPVFGLQTDSKYYENPEDFKPERFIELDRENTKRCTYMPFGEGPRACLGQRFGNLQLKVGLAYIINNYKLSVNGKTRLPFKFDPKNIMLTPVGGIWLNFEKIAK